MELKTDPKISQTEITVLGEFPYKLMMYQNCIFRLFYFLLLCFWMYNYFYFYSILIVWTFFADKIPF